MWPGTGVRLSGVRCGTGSTWVLQRGGTYAEAPAFPVAAGEALLCCALPARSAQAVDLALHLAV